MKGTFPESLRSLAEKNEGEDRFFVIFKNFKKIDPKKFAIHMCMSETFYKNYNIPEVQKNC